MNPFYQPGYSYPNNASSYPYRANNFPVSPSQPAMNIESMYSNVQPYSTK